MSKNRFGYEWTRYPKIIPLYETQFRAWTQPFEPEYWKGRHVLDAGCGTGRNSLWPLKYGAARLTSFDVDPRTVEVARANLAEYPNAEVERHSIYEIPWENRFDTVFSIGVIHHLAEPRRAVEQLVRAAKPGGTVLIWVYGYEGHRLAKNLVNAARTVTSRLPLPLLNVLTVPASLLWWLSARCLPSRDPYMQQFRKADYWHVHSILFDQLLPEIANYWTRDEALALFDGLPVTDLKAVWVNGLSWTLYGTKR